MTASHISLKLDKICRGCLSEENILVSVFESSAVPNIPEMFEICTSLQISEDDGYPSKICSKCVLRLKESYQFRQMCVQSHFNMRNVKLEEVEEYSSNKAEAYSDSDDPERSNNQESNIFDQYVDEEGDQKIVFQTAGANSDENIEETVNDSGESNVANYYECDACSEKFKTFRDLKQHEFDWHMPGKMCTICNKIFTSVDEVMMCSSSEEEPFSASDEDPLYIPSDEDNESESNQTIRYSKERNENKLYQAENDMTVNSNEKNILEKVKPNYKRKPDFCYFCKTEVQNFARHITRNHNHESEVAKILTKSKFDKERRHLLDILRRKGNYLKCADNCFKPVRTPSLQNRCLLPCDNCLGFFSSKLLYRHRKKCGSQKSKNAQAAGQSQLTSHLRIDHHLKEQVFPHMRADKISLTAKKDTLICSFGARYLKSHGEKHFVNVTSRKMRELARILIEVQKMEPSIKSMFDVLQGKYFDLIVAATKIVAKYNQQQDRYESPTFATNIATSLKQCCDIAIYFVLKKEGQYANVATAEAESSLKTMIHLINTNWRFEISTQAAGNLDLNKWNKTTIIPLATDLKLLRQYIMKKSEDAIEKLKSNHNDTSAYNTLMETIYCRVLLLSRRRPGELQRMLLHSYTNVQHDKQHYEEFNTTVSSTETILLKKIKRVVIRGKKGRGVPVLFSEDVQEHIKLLLQVRINFVSTDNTYLFAKSALMTPVAGYKVLRKYAKDCGAKNPMAITSTRLRKHLAILSQVFNLKENELEQLATFMGHTKGIHENSYRLSDDIFQMAKISKVLLLMENSNLNNYEGKSLDDIDVNIDEDLIEKNESSGGEETEEFIEPSCSIEPQPSCSGQHQEVPVREIKIKKGKKRELVPWTTQQKNLVKQYFNTHIKDKKPPRKNECEHLKEKYPDVFCNKNWLKIKVFIQNQYTKYTD